MTGRCIAAITVARRSEEGVFIVGVRDQCRRAGIRPANEGASGHRRLRDEVEMNGVQEQVHVVELEPNHAAVPVGREFVTAWVERWGFDQLSGDASLLTSEMLSNAVIHARTPIELRVHQLAEGVRIEVRDGAEYGIVPPRKGEGPQARGLGLRVVAKLASRWGIDPVPDGKTVWAEIRGSRSSEALVEPELGLGPTPLPVPGDWPEIRLVNVPTRLFLAWEDHTRDLVREFALVALPPGPGKRPAPDYRIAEVVGILDRFWELVRPIWAQARAVGENLPGRISLTVRLPGQVVTEAPRFLEALDAANDLARRGLLLTDPAPGELMAFGHWFVHAVVRQMERATGGGVAAGEEPEERCPFPA
jgi:anti-sigma regulatory factor (Ser/Thr protein kinase)